MIREHAADWGPLLRKSLLLTGLLLLTLGTTALVSPFLTQAFAQEPPPPAEPADNNSQTPAEPAQGTPTEPPAPVGAAPGASFPRLSKDPAKTDATTGLPGISAPTQTAPAASMQSAPAATVPATEPPAAVAPSATGDTVESLQKEIDNLEKDTSLDAAVQDQAIQAYRFAIDSLQKSQAYRKQVAENQKILEMIPQEASAIQKELAELPEKYAISVNAESSLKEIEQATAEAEIEMRNFQTELTNADQRSNQRPLQRKQQVELQASHPERIKDARQALDTSKDPTASSIVVEAVNKQNQVKIQMLEAEGELTKALLSRYDLEASHRLLPLRLELWTRKTALQKKKLETLQQLLNQKKREETQHQLADLKKESDQTFPILQSHITDIENYSEQITELVDRTETIQARLSEINTLLSEVSTNEEDSIEKDRSDAGNSEFFALSLLRQLYELPDIEPHREELQERRDEMSETTFKQIEIHTLARRFINIDAMIDDSIQKIKQELKTDDLGFLEQGLRNNLRKLLTQKRETLETLDNTYNSYLEILTTLNANQESLVKTINNYQQFIRKRIFWIRSDKSLTFSDLLNLFDASQLPLSWAEIQNLERDYQQDLSDHTWIHMAGFVIWVMLILLRVQAGRELILTAEQARKSNNAHLLPTLRAILLTVLISAPGPMLVWFVGWRLGEASSTDSLHFAVGSSLMLIGTVYGILEFFRQLCRRNGVVDAHFNGPNILSTRFRRDLFILMVTILPVFFIVLLMNRLTTDQNRMNLERVLFCVGMVWIALYARRVLNPNGKLMREMFLLKHASPVSRTRWIWYPIATLGPVVLAIMAWVGYYYAASQLAWKLLLTLWLLCTILFLWGLCIRWYRITQRWFRMYIMRERRRRPTEETQTVDGQRLKLDQEGQISEEDRERQTLKLINYGTLLPLLFGLGMIWSDVLPAVSYLDEIPLWYTDVQSVGTGVDGDSSVRTVREAITPINLAVAIAVAMITIIFTRNMPGVVDYILLQRVGLDASLRYAFTSVIGYLLTFIGVTYAFGQLGFRWEQIQWLAAALTFGLSFGLQEIFANFVSGLIILFERPIRIGDIVTVEGVTGVVTRIRIRASTITDWDRKEYLVPNKELVTGRLLNWTLTDTLNRIVIPVGIAYGSDTDRVRDVLFEIARKDPEVLNDPATVVVFDAFQDSSLKFTFIVYLATLERRMETIHRLHTNIHRRFMEEKIEISFPQQDLHVRSFPPGWPPMAASQANPAAEFMPASASSNSGASSSASSEK